MKKVIRGCLFLIMFAFAAQAFAQQVPKGLELLEIVKITTAYQLSSDLSFDISIAYADSATQNAPTEEMQGSYKIHNGKYWSRIDSSEFIQGNQYRLGVYHQDSLIVVKAKEDDVNVMEIPMMDSLFRAAHVADMEVVAANDSTNVLKIFFYPESYYRSYEMEYDVNSLLINQIKYFISDAEHIEDSLGNYTEVLKISCVSIQFSNYSDEAISEDYFDESKYIYFQEDKFWVQPAYLGYEVMSSLENQ